MRIDGLVVDPRRKGSMRVQVGGRVAWTVPADLVTELGLFEGAIINGGTVARLERGADEEGALRAGLRALERRNHAQRELAIKLIRKGHPEEAVAAAMSRLLTLGLLDDHAFARHYFHSRTERGRGPYRIRHDLMALGVSREIVEAVIAAADTTEDPLARARALAGRRARQMEALPRETRRRRLSAFLARRGYGSSERKSIIDDLLRVPGGD